MTMMAKMVWFAVGSLAVLLCSCERRDAPAAPSVGARVAPLSVVPAEAAPRPWPAAAPLPVLTAPAPVAPAARLAGAHERSPRKTRVLLITATEADLPFLAMRGFLEQLGVPFDTLVATTTELTAARLSDGTTGQYQAIILATSNLAYDDGGTWRSAFTDAEWQTLWAYEADFGVRQMTYYSVPGSYPDDLGLELVGTRQEPMDALFSGEGAAAFSYLRTRDGGGAAVPLQIRNSYAYLARPRDASVTPLLTWDGHALLSVKRYADGRENLAGTFAHNPDLRHSLLLNYGMINWLTRGVFVGERHLYLLAHVDDFLLSNFLWDPVRHESGTATYRMDSTDLQTLLDWQEALPGRRPSARGLKLEMAFNGLGATAFGADDRLTAEAAAAEGSFYWMNHTYSHPLLDTAGYGVSRDEIILNNAVAADVIGASVYHTAVLATGGFSGLDNPTFLRATYNNGVRYVASNPSVPGQAPPVPNAGVPHPLDPRITLLPRRPSNLFFNVSTAEEWVDEYNTLFRGFWGRDLTLAEILDADTEVLLSYMLKYTWVPMSFHQSNARTLRDGGRAWQLVTEYLDVLLAKYERLYTLPLVNVPWYQAALYSRRLMQVRDSGLEGVLDPGAGTLTLQVQREARIPVTGVPTEGAEDYGGQPIGHVRVKPGTPVTLPLR